MLREMAGTVQHKRMTKVLYLSFNDPDLSPGVLRKEREFCEFCHEIGKSHGIEFHGLCIVASVKRESETISFGKCYTIKKVPSGPYRFFSRIPIFCSLFRTRPVFDQAYGDIGRLEPDVVIWRYTVTTVPGIFNPKKIRPGLRFITEHQAKEAEELRVTPAGRALYPVIGHMGKRVLSLVDAVIGVTSEITDYELSLIGRDIPSFTLTNSIDVDLYPLKRHREMKDNTLKLLYVGSNTSEWHGLDRILKGMAGYQGGITLELHLAGSVSSSIKNLISSLHIEDRINAHGYVTGRDLDALFDNADVAVGTLGMHRKNLSQGSTLKVREYMARGMPFVISYADDDLSPGLPYVFMAPPDDSPIDMQALVRFILDLHSSGNEIPEIMRIYAREHMDYQVKVVRLMDFISSLVKQ